MKVLGLAFSARKHGNCQDCVNCCLQKFRDENFETQLINLHDYKIKPCSNCNYECFSERIRGTKETCPVDDDLPKIYQAFENSQIIIFGIPTYVGHVPAIFKTFEERSLGIYGFGKHENVLMGKIYGFIVLGSYFALNEALYRFHGSPITWILLRSREYGLDPLKAGLVENQDVKNRLDRFTSTLIKLAKEKAP